ncbi:MAG: hypothetical protein E7603_04660 [Ruminococcaceae bacterium]|nr:hypothetical protein [Oscillospiraceae bacterium]
MKDTFFRVLTIALAVLLTVSLILSAVALSYATDIKNNQSSKVESSIASIDEQVASINNSVKALKALDAELGGYVDTLKAQAAALTTKLNETDTQIEAVEKEMGDKITASEATLLASLNSLRTEISAQIATINNSITALQDQDAKLDQKIAELQTYTDSEIQDMKDWAEATFVTAEQYKDVAWNIADINAQIQLTNKNITTLVNALSDKINTSVADAMATLRAEADANNAANVEKIEAAVNSITASYKAAIAAAKKDIIAACESKLDALIVKSEASLKSWMNNKLAGYYTIAEANAKLEAQKKNLETSLATQKSALEKLVSDLSVKVDTNDATVKGLIATATASIAACETTIAANAEEIARLQTSLAQLETTLTAAYTTAIENAVNGVNVSLSAVNATIETSVNTINSNLTSLETRVAAVESSIKDINTSLETLSTSLKALEDRVGRLEVYTITVNGFTFDGQEYDVRVRPTESDSTDKASMGDVIRLLATAPLHRTVRNNGVYSRYVLKYIVKDADGNDVPVINNEFIMPLSNVTVTAEYNLSFVEDGIHNIVTAYDEEGLNLWKRNVSYDDSKSCNLILGADITLTAPEAGQSNWTPIPEFFGTIDGNGKTITGLTMTGSGNLAFVDTLYGTIKNINFADVNISSNDAEARVAVVVANMNCYVPENDGDRVVGMIENCHVLSGTVTGKNETAGLVAYMTLYNTYDPLSDRVNSIIGCTNNATITGEGDWTAGIVAHVYRGTTSAKATIKDCVNSGAVTGAGKYCAGIAAHTEALPLFENCSNSGIITSSGQYCAGVVAYTLLRGPYAEKSIVGCSNSGDIILNTSVKNSSAAGVHASYNSWYAGPYAYGTTNRGPAYSYLSGCYNTGSVTHTNTYVAAEGEANIIYTGGVIANIGNGRGIIISACYNSGLVQTKADASATVYNGLVIGRCNNIHGDNRLEQLYSAPVSGFTASEGYTLADLAIGDNELSAAEATDWNAVATAMNSVMPKDEYTGQERTYRYRYTVSAEAGAPLALTKVDQYS